MPAVQNWYEAGIVQEIAPAAMDVYFTSWVYDLDNGAGNTATFLAGARVKF